MASESCAKSYDTTEAFAALVERHLSAVCAVAYSATGCIATSEDVAQETFLVAWRKRSSLHELANLPGWLLGVARTLSKNTLRRSGREVLDGDAVTAQVSDRAPGALGALIDREGEALVWAALREIPEDYREVLVLYYREGRSAREVARGLGISEDATMQRLSRGRALLRAEVERSIEGTLERSRPGSRLVGSIVAGTALAEPPSTAGAGAPPSPPAVTPFTAFKGVLVMKSRVAVAAAILLAIGGATGLGWATYRSAGHAMGRNRTDQVSNPTALPPTGMRFPGSHPSEGAGQLHSEADGDNASREIWEDGIVDETEVHAVGEPKGGWVNDSRTRWDICMYAIRSGSVVVSLSFPSSGGTAEVRDVQLTDGARTQPIVMLSPHGDGFRELGLADLGEALRNSSLETTEVWDETGRPRMVVFSASNTEPIDPTLFEVSRDAKQLDGAVFARHCLREGLSGLVWPAGGPPTARLTLTVGPVEAQPELDPALYRAALARPGPARGAVGAPITMVAYVDFSCSYSGTLLGTLDELLERYPGQLRVVMRHFPVRAGSPLAAEAAQAAEAQGKFFEMHDRLFANPERLTRADLLGYARDVGLDLDRFTRAIDQGEFRESLAADRAEAQALGVIATPSVLLDGELLGGLRPKSAYIERIDAALARAATAH